jgi:hypothetical protein
MAVSPIANSMGKKIAKTGVSRVPKPKPEKKVSRDAIAAIRGMSKYSINFPNSSF